MPDFNLAFTGAQINAALANTNLAARATINGVGTKALSNQLNIASFTDDGVGLTVFTYTNAFLADPLFYFGSNFKSGLTFTITTCTVKDSTLTETAQTKIATSDSAGGAQDVDETHCYFTGELA